MKAIQRECGVDFRADDRIEAGCDWTDSIADGLAEADVRPFLISTKAPK